jgi:hypothetical protein
MRRLTVALVLTVAFAAGVLAGFGTRPAVAGTRCWTTECSGGEALYCCRTNGKLICKVLICG